MAKIVFKCLRCGRCCKNLFKEELGVVSGLTFFFEKEKNLFPKRFVSPATGFGWGVSGPKYVIRYQLNTNTCPHLSKDNFCNIYDKRPIICQAFPLSSLGSLGTTVVDPKDCSFLEKIEKEVGSLTKMLPMTPKKFRGPKEWQAIAKINAAHEKPFTGHPIDAKVVWKFDLKNKEWRIFAVV